MEHDGYTLLSDEYENSHTPLKYQCPKGHEHHISWDNWNLGYRCPICSGKFKKSIENIDVAVGSEGYQLLNSCYSNNKQKLDLVCPNGHEYSVSWDNWNSKGSRCPKCSEWGVSSAQKEIYDFVKGLCGDALMSDRTFISPLEIDILIPSKKIAIEYCGLYWHSELQGKDRRYHTEKLDRCLKENFRIHLWPITLK
jgi:hypothetical protein